MDKTEAAYSLVTASILAAFLVVPSMADNTSSLAPMPPGAHDPVYVWQGQTIQGHSAQTVGDAGLPQAVEAGSVRYITGGIGEEERNALEAAKSQYNLHITSTGPNGEFKGETQITIRDRKGDALLNASAGPLFYVDLPPGTYTVEASSDERTEKHRVTIGEKNSSSLYFRW